MDRFARTTPVVIYNSGRYCGSQQIWITESHPLLLLQEKKREGKDASEAIEQAMPCRDDVPSLNQSRAKSASSTRLNTIRPPTSLRTLVNWNRFVDIGLCCLSGAWTIHSRVGGHPGCLLSLIFPGHHSKIIDLLLKATKQIPSARSIYFSLDRQAWSLTRVNGIPFIR